MKILLCSDIHSNMRSLRKLAKKARKEDVDLVICAGDMTNFEEKLDYVLFELNEIGVPVLLIHGNHESEDAVAQLAEIFDNMTFIHNDAHEIDEYLFIGFGGGGFSSTDKQFKKSAARLKKKIKSHHKVVLVTHGPPHNTELDNLDGNHVGNKDFRKFIEEVQPLLAVSGHIHENFGKTDKIKKTMLINPGDVGVVLEI